MGSKLPMLHALSGAAALMARRAGQALQAYDMSWPQALSLLVLQNQTGPTNATRLVAELGLGRTAMTSVVDRLIQRGWVERHLHPHDRRTLLLALSPAGRGAADAAAVCLETAFADPEGAVSDWSTLHAGLAQFISVFADPAATSLASDRANRPSNHHKPQPHESQRPPDQPLRAIVRREPKAVSPRDRHGSRFN